VEYGISQNKEVRKEEGVLLQQDVKESESRQVGEQERKANQFERTVNSKQLTSN
tara:strand:- start:860 stop:1021 length:162 start_codon:yes stop_codon:yes gene_type:complete